MKLNTLIISLCLFVSLALPHGLAAQTQTSSPARYTVTDLGTFGGTYSFAYSINSSGSVAGGAAAPGQTNSVAQTAFLWNGGHLLNLGTLGGSACPGCSSEGAAVSPNEVVAVISETAAADPNGEDFCAFGTHRQCLAAIWDNGVMTALPTLPAGNNSQAYFVNNQGEIIGLSETNKKDVTCSEATPFQVYRFEAAKWEPNSELTALAPLRGDTVSFGFGINGNGEAVGVSGLCSNTSAPPVSPASLEAHPVLWDADGTPHALAIPVGSAGTLNVAVSINNEGEVVGGSAMSDGTLHAFLWTSAASVPEDLGTYPQGAPITVVPCCGTINDRGQIVGFSVDAAGNIRALLWQHGLPVDLNSLVVAGSHWYLLAALSINDQGEVVGYAVNTSTSDVHAFLARPNAGTGSTGRGATEPPVLPPAVKAMLLHHYR